MTKFEQTSEIRNPYILQIQPDDDNNVVNNTRFPFSIKTIVPQKDKSRIASNSRAAMGSVMGCQPSRNGRETPGIHQQELATLAARFGMPCMLKMHPETNACTIVICNAYATFYLRRHTYIIIQVCMPISGIKVALI